MSCKIFSASGDMNLCIPDFGPIVKKGAVFLIPDGSSLEKLAHSIQIFGITQRNSIRSQYGVTEISNQVIDYYCPELRSRTTQTVTLGHNS